MMLFVSAQQVLAQKSITGIVLDHASSEPLIGVSVAVQGSTKGVITDIDGRFAMNDVKADDMLEVSYIGYTTVTQRIGSETEFVFSLKEGVALNEVTVTALGIKRETKALGYATQKLDVAEIDNVKDANLLNNLSGRMAGINIVQGPTGVGSSSRLVIRGETSFTNNNALYVVDGIPIANYTAGNVTNESSSGFQTVDYGNGAGEINPDDIETISVLKGPAAAALYGSRAGNGVVLITTKSGANQKGLGVSFNSTTTFESPLTMPSYQNTYGQGVNQQFEFGDGLGGGLGINDDEDQSWGPAFGTVQSLPQFDSPSTTADGRVVLGGDVLARAGAVITPTAWEARPDNVRDFFETGVTTTNNLAIAGGSDKVNYRLSYTNLYNEGMVPGTNLKRNNVSLRTGFDITDKLNVTAAANYINTVSDHRPANGYGSENHMYVFTWYGRQVNTGVLKDHVWQDGLENIQQFNYNYAWHDNPYLNSYINTNALDKNRIIGNIAATYNFLDNLSLTVRTGLDYVNEDRFSKRAFSTQRFKQGGVFVQDVNFTERNTDFLLRYNTYLSEDLSFNISLGGNRMKQESNSKYQGVGKLATPGIYSLNNAAEPIEVSSFDSEKAINSLYGLGQFGYKNFLYLDLTARNDWSSTLPKENNSYFYPSASLSLVASEIMDLPSAISFLKLRTSLAQVGNDTDPYQLRSVYQASSPYNSQPTTEEQSTLPNAELKPERLTSFEIGTDIRLFNGRVNFDYTYFNTKSKDQIINLPIAGSTGYNSRVVNGGEIKSTGHEIVLGLNPIRRNNFSWHSTFNFTTNKSVVEKLPDGVDQYVLGYARVYSNDSRTVWVFAQEGQELGNMYGTGFLQSPDGQDVYNSDGIPVKDPNFRVLGNYNPDFTLGWDNSFKIGNINFGFLFDYRHGGTVVSRTLSIASTSGNLDTTEERPEGGIVGQGVVQQSDGTYVPNTTAIPAVRYYKAFYDRDNEANHLYDATFLKLREMKIGYTFPKSTINGVENLSIHLVGRNLFLATENKHFDPEVLAVQGNNFIPGVEDMAYPSARSIGLNIKANF